MPWYWKEYIGIMHQSVYPQRGGRGQPKGFWQLSDISPMWLWHWCSDKEAVLTFKIKRLPSPGVGNRGDSDTKGVSLSENVDRRHFQMSECHGSARGGTRVIHID